MASKENGKSIKRLCIFNLAAMKEKEMSFFFLLFASLLISSPSSSSSQQQNLTSFSFSDSPWRPNQNNLLLSINSTFAAGFHPRPNSPNNFTFSIWYNNLSADTIVWSARRQDGTPLLLSVNASLAITPAGELSLTDDTGKNLLPGLPTSTSNSTRLQLNEEGNLRYDKWESFGFPTDTFLPNQTINGTELTSNNGKFSFKNSSSLVFNSSDNYWSTDSTFVQLNPDGSLLHSNAISIISADFGIYRPRRLKLDNDGNLRIYSFNPDRGGWFISWQAVQELCKVHGVCGPNAICVSNGPNNISCVCPAGYLQSPQNPDSCQRKTPLSANTRFLRLDYVNFTGLDNQNQNVKNITTCRASCLNQANCVAFMFAFNGKGSCGLQLGGLIYGMWSPGTEAALFLRVDASETDQSNFRGMTTVLKTTCPVRIALPYPPEEFNTTTRNIAIISTLFAAELIAGVIFFWAFLKKYIKYRDMARTLGLELLPTGGPKRFSYAELKAATNDFCNAIGKGGFGDVYRGELPDKRIVAVKCLKDVTGGDTEFWAEVTIIARMHHLNLVRLWGFCAEKGHKILVYEYVSNGSLDKYLFPAGGISAAPPGDESEEMGLAAVDGPRPMLDWGIRYRIALGVARAIAYLHEECLEWVLHCDIKPENILLGDDFCPKISDFGLAKLRKKEDLVSMSRIRGTRGYMAPEWIRSDPITPKADVYSFGMVLLEIVTGSRNFDMQGLSSSTTMESEDWYFPRWAFEKAFKEKKVEDILDRQIKDWYDGRVHFDMVDRMVKTAMWCLQDRPDMRPSMGKVAKMLEGTVEITEPKKPTIFFLVDE